jgi:hypothetical protein
MDENHILNLNLFKVIKCLEPILPPDQINLIRKELYSNVGELLKLAHIHLKFAFNVKGKEGWRQKVSRGYYACYSASRAVRLAFSGVYSTDLTDHKNIGDLPKDFPYLSKWQEFFTKYKGDRNLADYDHSGKISSLEMKSDEYLKQTKIFLDETKQYLKNKGIIK